jgi:hypothetical protein
MTKDDIIVVCAGSNDISKNSAKEGISNIINFVKKTSHTNIIVMEALHRHDLADWSCVNKEIKRFNRLLAKRLKLYKHAIIRRVNLDRQHFTKHGLHLNYKGKGKSCQQIAESIQRKVESRANIATPIEYKVGAGNEEAIPLKVKEDTVHEESAGIQVNEAEETVVDPSLNSVVLSERDQHQEIRSQPGKGSPQ